MIRRLWRFPAIIVLVVVAAFLVGGSGPVATGITASGSRTTPAPPTSTGVPKPVGVPGSWTLKFSDEFNGSSLNSSKWGYCWDGRRSGCAHDPELQWYQSPNVTLSGGSLHLTAKKESARGHAYTSGMVTSKYSYQYGFAEARVRVPKGQGLWPAFWTLTQGGGWPPEIDIMEILGHQPSTAYMVYHPESGEWSSAGYTGPDFSAGYHTFGMSWSPGAIRWYIDGVEGGLVITSAITSKPQYLLLNLAVGSSWPGNPDASTPFPSSFDIDYVRVWQ